MRRFFCLFYRFPQSDGMELLKIFQKMRLIGVVKPGHGILHAEFIPQKLLHK